MCSIASGDSEEERCYARLWILIQAYVYLLSDANVLLHCVEHFCWNFLKANSECEYFDSKCSKSYHRRQSPTKASFWICGFLKFLLIILRLITRDNASIAHQRNSKMTRWTTAKYHDLLNVSENSSEHDLLAKWIKNASSEDFEQLSHLFDYFRTFHSSFTHMSEFCPRNITQWRNHLLKEVILQEGISDNGTQRYPFKNVLKPQVSDGALLKAEYIARCWLYPVFSGDMKLLAMNLKLCPSDFARGTNPFIVASSPRKLPTANAFISLVSRYSAPDIRPRERCQPSPITSRSYPAGTRHFGTRDVLEPGRLTYWRRLDNAMQKANTVISEIEQQLESTSCFVGTLLNNKQKATAETFTTYSSSDERLRSRSSSRASGMSGTSKTSIMEQYELVNDERYSMDSSREPQHPEIERLNLDLLSPQPVVRNTAIFDNIAPAPMPPAMQISQRTTNTHSPLPMWLKLLPAKQKDFLLSLVPTVNQTKERRKLESTPKSQQPQMKLLEFKKEDELHTGPPSNLKFELVTTIASRQLLEM